MAIFDMGGEIGLVADAMLPKPSLPNAAFIFARLAGTDRYGVWTVTGESRFYFLPANREISVSVWQCPHCMNVVRQHDHCVAGYRVLRHHRRICRSQKVNFAQEQV